MGYEKNRWRQITRLFMYISPFIFLQFYCARSFVVVVVQCWSVIPVEHWDNTIWWGMH